MVEPEYFDEDVEDIDGSRSKKRKRKPTGRQSKRARVIQPGDDSICASLTASQTPRMSGESQETPGAADDDDDDEDDDTGARRETAVDPATLALSLAGRWETYFEWSDCAQCPTGTKNSPGIDPALRDLVRGIPCRRTPWKVYYSKNKELGKSFASLRR